MSPTRSGWLLLLMVLVCTSAWAQKPDFDKALKERQKLVAELKAEVVHLPDLNKTAQALEKELQDLVKSVGHRPPEPSVPLPPPPDFTKVAPVKMETFSRQQQSQLQQLDGDIKQLQEAVQVMQQRRYQIARLESQIAVLKREKAAP